MADANEELIDDTVAENARLAVANLALRGEIEAVQSEVQALRADLHLHNGEHEQLLRQKDDVLSRRTRDSLISALKDQVAEAERHSFDVVDSGRLASVLEKGGGGGKDSGVNEFLAARMVYHRNAALLEQLKLGRV